jgi:hypothetical protein
MEMSLPLTEIFELLFDLDWRRSAPTVFRRSRRQIGRWCSGETALPSWALRRIERLALEAGADLERWKRAKYQEIDDQARERLALAQNTVTACKLRLIGRDPPLGPGRPRKRRRLALWEWRPVPIRPARVRKLPMPAHKPLRPHRPSAPDGSTA